MARTPVNLVKQYAIISGTNAHLMNTATDKSRSIKTVANVPKRANKSRRNFSVRCVSVLLFGLYIPVAEPTFNGVSHLVCKLDALVSLVVEGKSCFRFWVGEGDAERLNTFLIGSDAGNVSLICGDFSAGADGVSSIFTEFVDLLQPIKYVRKKKIPVVDENEENPMKIMQKEKEKRKKREKLQMKK